MTIRRALTSGGRVIVSRCAKDQPLLSFTAHLTFLSHASHAQGVDRPTNIA